MKKWRIRGYTPLHKKPVEIFVTALDYWRARKLAKGFVITSVVLVEE